jgi:hypothetical protein
VAATLAPWGGSESVVVGVKVVVVVVVAVCGVVAGAGPCADAD